MSSTYAPTLPTPSKGLGAGRIIAIVLGLILTLAGIGSLLGAGVLGWANATQRDSQGYFSTSTNRFTSSTYAITSDRIDLNSGAGPGEWFTTNDNIATVRIRAKTPSNVFVGIGSQADVDRYLSGVAHDELTKVTYKPFAVTYRLSPGSTTPALPANQTFWVAKAEGQGTRTLTWTPTQGAWAVVVMNADATPVVAPDIGMGVRVTFLGWIIGALAIGGIISALFGTLLIALGSSRSRRSSNGASEHLVPRSPGMRAA